MLDGALGSRPATVSAEPHVRPSSLETMSVGCNIPDAAICRNCSKSNGPSRWSFLTKYHLFAMSISVASPFRLVVAVLIVAVLCTLLVQNGWLLGFPILVSRAGVGAGAIVAQR